MTTKESGLSWKDCCNQVEIIQKATMAQLKEIIKMCQEQMRTK